jgi:L-lactate dehydrogenase complex protein LldG
MSSAREQILAGIRRGLRRGPLDDLASAVLEAKLAAPRRGIVPERSRSLAPEATLAVFEKQARDVACTVTRVATLADVPEAVRGYLASQNLPAEIESAPDPLLDHVPWAKAPLLKVARGMPSGREGVGVTSALAGIAETGTLMLASGPSSPATMNFLPDTHVAVVPASRFVGAYEDAWDRLRAKQGSAMRGDAMPRTVNFITGPSRTGDIEQKLEMGAHGPRRLHIVIIEDPSLA